MVLAAAREGVGAARLPSSLVQDDIRGGRLITWGASDSEPIALWALHTSRRLTSPKVKAFVDFLCVTFG